MKRKIYSIIVLILFIGSVISGQVTEGEKTLRTQSADTTLGWKKGGIVSINLAQTSLTNRAAGGQKSVAINGIFSRFANFKSEKLTCSPIMPIIPRT